MVARVPQVLMPLSVAGNEMKYCGQHRDGDKKKKKKG